MINQSIVGASPTMDNNDSNVIRPPPPPLPPAMLGKSDSTIKGYRTGELYINRFLAEYGYPSLIDLTEESVEGDHLINFIENVGNYIACTNFDKKDGGGELVGASAKTTYFKAVKEVFRNKFPNHELWRDSDDWWGKQGGVWKRFEKARDRHKIEDPDVTEGRKSEPLYRDVNASSKAVRAVYSGDTIVDAKSIATSMIKNGKRNSAKDAGKLLEFTLCRLAIARGGEHAFPRYNEGAYDMNFNAPDFDWSIIKQTERQCMLFFCDRLLYCLCPFFAFGVYFLFGGLRRDGCSDATKDFIFPHLHNVKKESVAAGLTRDMRANMPQGERYRFTSRSTRKGGMTDCRMHPDLSLQEEYARSGHTYAPGSNNNAEGYIESTPAMNAPGGLAMAGYVNCHIVPVPYNFSCLGEDDLVVGSVNRLISEMFVNDVPELQYGKPLRRLLITSAARLVGSFNELVRDVTPEPTKHDIVLKIMQAAQRAKIDDKSVSIVLGVPRYYHVLKAWSSKIKVDFNSNNPMKPPQDAALSQQIVGLGNLIDSLSDRITALEASVDSRAEDKAMGELVRDSNKITASENENLKRQLAEQRREIKKLKAALASLTQTTPSASASASKRRVPGATDLQEVLDEADKEEEEEQEEEVRAPAPKKPRTASSQLPLVSSPPPAAAAASVNDALDGVHQEWSGVSGITVQDELERIWKEYHRKRSSSEEEARDTPSLPSKNALYKTNYLLCGVHPAFVQFKEAARYCKGMTIVAIAMSKEEWASLLAGTMESLERRQLFNLVETNAMSTAYELEVQCGKRTATSKLSSLLKPTLHSLGNRYQEICKRFKNAGKSDLEIEQMVKSKVHGGENGTQKFIGDFFGGGN